MIAIISGFLLSCMTAPELHCIESLHPPGHPITSAVLEDMIKETTDEGT
jgi:hypothetical protein